jgi:hypothetical protein
VSQLTRRVLLEFPASLTVTVVSNTRIDVSWSAVRDVVNYRVYRNGVLTDSPTTEAVSATGLQGSTQYLFAVSCVDAVGHEGPRSPTQPGTTFVTPDTTLPTAPTIFAGSPTLSSVSVSLIAPAVDTGSGVASYTLQRATDAAFTQNLVTTSGLTSFPQLISNLLSATQYFFRLRAVDVAGNIGPFSAAVNVTTTSQSPPQFAPFWPNWPIMNCACTQSVGPASLDQGMTADKDLVIVTSFYPTTARMQTRCDAIDAVWALQDQTKIVTKFAQYVIPSVAYKVLPTPIDGERAFNLEVILANSPTIQSSPRWKVHRVDQPGDSGLCENMFNPAVEHQVNVTAGAGLSASSKDYATHLWERYDSVWTTAYKSRMAGFFHDVFNQVPETLSQNNGATVVTDIDYNNDGVIDVGSNFGTGAGNGGRQWALGMLNTLTKWYAQFPGKHAIVNAARVDSAAVLPLHTAPFYRTLEFPLDESIHNNLSLSPTGTGWNVAGTPGNTGRLTAFYQAYYRIETAMRLESDMGADVKGAYLFHSPCANRTPNSADMEVIRFISLAALLVERGAPCVTAGTAIMFSLDELLVDLGAPIGNRSMGTLDENTGILTLRTPDFTSGTFGKFFWARFTKGLVVINGATPSTGAYPSADAAVAIPLASLPAPGAGLKYQRLGPSYTNSRTGRTTRNQSPTLNTGADVTSAGISLKPLHAQMLLTVPV